jgi:hypothetical protein
MRPDQPWGDVVQVLNRRGGGQAWTAQRLRRAVHRLASEGIIEASLLERAQRRPADDRLVALVAGIVRAAPAMRGKFRIRVKSGHKVGGRPARARLVISPTITRLAWPLIFF